MTNGSNKKKSQKAGKKKAKRGASQRTPRTATAKMLQGLEACEKVYARALADPFDSQIYGRVCYPGFPVKESVKMVGQQSATVGVGTNGVGWLMFDVTPVNDSGAIYYTDTTYGGTLASSLATSGVGINGGYWNTPAPSSMFPETSVGNQFRMVCAGAQWRYTGTELDRGGSTYSLASPQAVSLSGATLTGCIANAVAREHSVKDQYQVFVLPPIADSAIEWKDSDQKYPWSDGGNTGVGPLACLVFVGKPGTTYNVKLVEHFECAGTSYNQYASPSHVGRYEIIQSLSAAAAAATYSKPEKTYFEQFVSSLKNVSESAPVKAAANFVAGLGFQYVARRLGIPPRAPQLLLSNKAYDVD